MKSSGGLRFSNGASVAIAVFILCIDAASNSSARTHLHQAVGALTASGAAAAPVSDRFIGSLIASIVISFGHASSIARTAARRFGLIFWIEEAPSRRRLLAHGHTGPCHSSPGHAPPRRAVPDLTAPKRFCVGRRRSYPVVVTENVPFCGLQSPSAFVKPAMA
ncbi:hypothetical protein V1281_006436 [Nitrobacteraceae bacterium AZCC 2161]